MGKLTGGVLIPVCSPCDREGRFLPGEFEATMARAAAAPADGVYVCGGTGEGLAMRPEERMAACEIAVAAARPAGKKVLAHVGAYARRDALELAAHAARAGADTLSVVPLPDADQRGLLDYYRAVAEVSGLDVIIYYTPGCSQSLSQVLEGLALPGVSGIKSSSNDFFFTMQLLEALPEGRILFSGKDEYLAFAVLQGAHGGIGMWANVFPEAYAEIYAAARAGELHRAIARQKTLNALCCIAFSMGLCQSFEAIHRYLGLWDRVFRAPAPRYDETFYAAFLARTAPLLEELCAGKREESAQ